MENEMLIWMHLNHPNIVPFYGVCNDFGPVPALISKYCINRGIMNYLERNPGANRCDLVSMNEIVLLV